MASIARELGDVQLILMCGHNEALAKRLQAMKTAARHAVVGFTSEVSSYMRISDFFIGKPGPGSLSEAVRMGLPVVTFENAWTMPQERFNARWVREQGIGKVLRSIRTVRAGVTELISQLPQYRQRVQALDNQAVFELPEILARLLGEASMPMRDPLGLAAPQAVT
jgi:UDP-N-acetylglucosamine:LPS N-acetylglucosamine transferase